MTTELWVILALCATVPFAAWLGRVTAPEAREVVQTVERVVEKRPWSRAELWLTVHAKMLNSSYMPSQAEYAASSAVAAWDADAADAKRAASHECPVPPRYPATCAHCNAPIEPLKETNEP